MGDAYVLAVDVGASTITAAVARPGTDEIVATTPIRLGRRDDALPAVAAVLEEGAILFGEDAQAHGLQHPQTRVDGFARLVGEDVPLVVSGWRLPAEDVFAQAVAHVVGLAAEREGRAPERVAVVCPVDWGEYRRAVIRRALDGAGVHDAELITAPLAAARVGAAAHPVEGGDVLVVYDLGAATFSVTVVGEDDEHNLCVHGDPVSLADVGSADVDDAVMRYAASSSDALARALEDDDPAATGAITGFRGDCARVKEALSTDAAAVIPVALTPHVAGIRLTRAELEAMAQPVIQRTLDAVDAALAATGTKADRVRAVVPSGGGARMPLVAQRLSEHLGRPVCTDADPAFLAVLGAAGWGWECACAAADAANEIEARDEALRVAPRRHAERPAQEIHALAAPAGNRWYSAALIAGAALVAAGIVLGGSMAAGLRLDSDDSAYPAPTTTDDDGPSDDAARPARASHPLLPERGGPGVQIMSPLRVVATRPAPPLRTGLRLIDDPPLLPIVTAPSSPEHGTTHPRRIPTMTAPGEPSSTVDAAPGTPAGGSGPSQTPTAPATTPTTAPAPADPPVQQPAPAEPPASTPDPTDQPAPAPTVDPDPPASTPDPEPPAPNADPGPTAEPAPDPGPTVEPAPDPTPPSPEPTPEATADPVL
jgi:hypothetical protein